jgi:hypothetical protein
VNGLIVVVLVLLLLVAVGGMAALALRRTERETTELPGPIDRIDVRLPAGRLVVSGIAARIGGGLVVERRAGWVFNRPSITEEVENRTLRIVVRSRSLVGRSSVDYTIAAPAGIEVRAVTGAGGIEVDGVDGMVDLGTGAGEIRLSALGGPVRLDTGAGRIKGVGLAGPEVEASTSSGTIDLTFTAMPERVDASTSAGSILLSVPGGPYRVDARTGAGRTEIGVPTSPDSSHTIRARSSAGSVTIRRG